MLDMNPRLLVTHRELLKKSEEKRLDAARGAAKALWSLSHSTRNKEAMRNGGIIPLLAQLIQSCHRDLVVPTMGAVQQCASQVAFQVGILHEGMIPDIVQHLSSDSAELKKHSAAAIFKCAESGPNRHEVMLYGGLEPLVRLAKDKATVEDKPLLAAVIGAIWKCAISLDNVIRLEQLNTVPILLGFLQDQPEDVIAHAAGGLAECAKLPENRTAIRLAGGLPKLTVLLNRPNPSLLHANVAKALGECANELESMEILDSLDTVRLIWTLLKSADMNVKCTATLALCPCIQNAKDSGEMVRSLVGGLELIMGLLHSPESSLLACACSAVAKIALDRENLAILTDHGIVVKLSELLTTGDEDLREPLVEAIGNCCSWGKNCYEFGRLGVIELIIVYLNTKNKGIRRNVAVALHQLSADPFNCCIIHESGVVPVLLQLTGSDDNMTQEAAAGCLANIRNLTYSLHEYKNALRLQHKS